MTKAEKFQQLRKKILDSEYGSLNPQQREAVYFSDAPLLILAGAGSGKTTVLVNKIGYLLRYGNTYNCEEPTVSFDDGDLAFLEQCLSDRSLRSGERYEALMAERPYSSHSLLGITFTNKAAKELRDRISQQFGLDTSGLWALTFHSTAMRILRRFGEKVGYAPNFSVYDESDSLRLIESILRKLGINEQYTGKKVKAEISRAKTEFLSPEAFADVFHDRNNSHIPLIYDMYQQALIEANAMDFDDLIFNAVKLLSTDPETAKKVQSRFRYVLVDEFQDTNRLQSRFVELLSAGGRICVVGDDDQSIYRFMGAAPDNILGFDKLYPDAYTVRLEQNYRSTNNILSAANAVIANNISRKGKNLWSDKGSGAKILYENLPTQHEEGEFIASTILNGTVNEGMKYSDYCVLYRTHAQSNSIETALRANGIPYKVYGSLAFYRRKEVQDMMAYLNVINNCYDNTRLFRIINEPKRGIGETTLEKINDLSAKHGMRVFDVIRYAGDFPELSKAADKLAGFASMIEKFSAMAKEEGTCLADLFEFLYREIGYEEMLRASFSMDDYQTKRQNVMELLSNIRQYEADAEEPSLEGYLEQTALVSATDTLSDDLNTVVLMTMHCAKGLEYENVFISGFEEGIFPSSQSAVSTEDIEEERRLCYVAMTRAKSHLYIISTHSRLLYGAVKPSVPSRFLEEIPEEFLEAQTYSAPQIQRERPVKKAPRIHHILSDKVTVIPEKHSGDLDFVPGQRVRHRIFGEGTVSDVVKMSSDALLTIRFDKVGDKKLMANFAKLEKI